MPVTINGTTGITTPALVNGTALAFRNKIINGDMRIDQRNGGAIVTYPGSGSLGSELYFLDRFNGNSTGSTRFSVQQVSDAPDGLKNSAKITVTTSGTPALGDFCYFAQSIEGQNIIDLNLGTGSATQITISFWVKSSLTGNFGLSLTNSAANRCYPTSYVINSANTWEKKTITLNGDISGTWLNTNGIGLKLNFDLGGGATNKNTANVWATIGSNGATGTISLVQNAGATFYITGVQLEAGSVATPFENRPIGTELALCQRYFETGAFYPATASGFPWTQKSFAVTKRTTPTLTTSPAIITGWNVIAMDSNGFRQDSNNAAAGQVIVMASAEL